MNNQIGLSCPENGKLRTRFSKKFIFYSGCDPSAYEFNHLDVGWLENYYTDAYFKFEADGKLNKVDAEGNTEVIGTSFVLDSKDLDGIPRYELKYSRDEPGCPNGVATTTFLFTCQEWNYFNYPTTDSTDCDSKYSLDIYCCNPTPQGKVTV